MKKHKLFVDTGVDQGTVVLNWHDTPKREFVYLAKAFHLTARDTAARLRQDRQFGLSGDPIKDFLAYPVVFMYRHALELYMKAIVLEGLPMLGIEGRKTIEEEELFSEHNLVVLRRHLQNIFEAYGWDWDLELPQFHSRDDFARFVAEFQAVDPASHTFRYTVDKRGKGSVDPHFKFDLFAVADVLDQLLPMMSGVVARAHDELAAALETMSREPPPEPEAVDP